MKSIAALPVKAHFQLPCWSHRHERAHPFPRFRDRPSSHSLKTFSGMPNRLHGESCLPQFGEKGKAILHFLPLATGEVILPFLGTVVAGTPLEPFEIQESIEVPASFLADGRNFALRVRGDSMVEEGIREGDIRIVSHGSFITDDRTVGALSRGNATVKRVFRRGDVVELRAANRRMETLRVPAQEVEIVGTVVGLLRQYRPRVSKQG